MQSVYEWLISDEEQREYLYDHLSAMGKKIADGIQKVEKSNDLIRLERDRYRDTIIEQTNHARTGECGFIYPENTVEASLNQAVGEFYRRQAGIEATLRGESPALQLPATGPTADLMETVMNTLKGAQVIRTEMEHTQANLDLALAEAKAAQDLRKQINELLTRIQGGQVKDGLQYNDLSAIWDIVAGEQAAHKALVRLIEQLRNAVIDGNHDWDGDNQDLRDIWSEMVKRTRDSYANHKQVAMFVEWVMDTWKRQGLSFDTAFSIVRHHSEQPSYWALSKKMDSLIEIVTDNLTAAHLQSELNDRISEIEVLKKRIDTITEDRENLAERNKELHIRLKEARMNRG